MNFQDKFIKKQLLLVNSIADCASLDLVRRVQDKLGAFMRYGDSRGAVITEKSVGGVRSVLAVPRDELRGGILLYLHGGGYTCGTLEYARGFAAVLSSELGMRVIAPEYRLAPENPYPAALLDAEAVYGALLDGGYTHDRIMLCGESAGGGLCYSLAVALGEKDEPMPAGIIAISPWCDLSLTGASYEANKNREAALSKKRLEFFADCYLGGDISPRKNLRGHSAVTASDKKKEPHVSPVYAELRGLPPSLIIVGGDEILLSDSVRMDAALRAADSKSTLRVKRGMWHAYLLYALESNKQDFAVMCDFVKRTMPRGNERKLRWMQLDNAAKIYPAAATSRWTNVYRLSATLTEEVRRDVLQSALDVTVRRFPSIAVRLRRGLFWYYLEEISHAPGVKDEIGYPLSRMPFDDIRTCAFRVLIYKRRIAIEFFHALTDGNGGLVFLKTLVAEYLLQRYGAEIPARDGVLDRLETPRPTELCDLFPKYAGKVGRSRRECDAYRIHGTREPDGFCNNTTFIMRAEELLSRAHALGVTVTALIAAAFVTAAVNIQNEEQPNPKRHKAVKVLLPVDLRRIYGGETLRNFVLYTTPGIDSRLGEYSLRETANIIQRQMLLDVTAKNMSARIYTNVKDEENKLLKPIPLFLKNFVMKIVFNLVGERKSTLSVSNLGVVKLPERMQSYVEHFDFILGVQSTAPYNAGLLTYGGEARLNIIRNIKEPKLEMKLYKVLKDIGIKVKVESNSRD